MNNGRTGFIGPTADIDISKNAATYFKLGIERVQTCMLANISRSR